jgi:UDP:flavonoid glycosyltransferase YjiC (YdhE family)
MGSRPRIDFLAPPFSGHLHPILGMARLAQENYQVRVLSTEAGTERIRAAGLEAVPLLRGADGVITGIANPPYAVGSNPLRLHRQFREAVKLLGQLGTEIGDLYSREPPQLLVADFTLPTAGLAAQWAGVPWWTSLPSPCVLETPDSPPAYFGGLPMARSVIGRCRDVCGRHLVGLFKRSIFWMYRSGLQSAGMSSPYRTDGSEAAYSPEKILALGLPELEFPRQWPRAVQFVGPMLYTPPTGNVEPEFRAGYRHVLISLGTHLAWRKEQFARDILGVANALPDVIFHFSNGTPSVPYVRSEGNNFQRLPFVDYERWLSHYDVVIHHGGAGVMYYCLAYGKPSLVYPLDYDQFDHAARLIHANLAVRIHRSSNVAEVLSRVLSDTKLAQRCKEFQSILERSVAKQEFMAALRLRLGE